MSKGKGRPPSGKVYFDVCGYCGRPWKTCKKKPCEKRKGLQELCDYVPEARPDGTVIG